jgi:hypothetical protein
LALADILPLYIYAGTRENAVEAAKAAVSSVTKNMVILADFMFSKISL